MLADLNTPEVADPEDLTLDELLTFADAHAELPMIFHYQGRNVKPGYHVTEVKAGQFAALDCGAKPETWTEIFVQIWDVDEAARTHMPAGKFAAIIRKVADHVGLDRGAKLTFEVSDGQVPMQLHRAGLPSLRGTHLHVGLSPRPSSCKPRDRWLANHAAKGKAGTGEASCCG